MRCGGPHVAAGVEFAVDRLLQALLSSHLLARAAVMAALADLIDAAGAAITPQLTRVVPAVLRFAGDADWAVRREVMRVAEVLAARTGTAIIPFRDRLLEILQQFKVDKVMSQYWHFIFVCSFGLLAKARPVRDAAAAAVETYRLLPPSTPSVRLVRSPGVGAGLGGEDAHYSSAMEGSPSPPRTASPARSVRVPDGVCSVVCRHCCD